MNHSFTDKIQDEKKIMNQHLDEAVDIIKKRLPQLDTGVLTVSYETAKFLREGVKHMVDYRSYLEDELFAVEKSIMEYELHAAKNLKKNIDLEIQNLIIPEFGHKSMKFIVSDLGEQLEKLEKERSKIFEEVTEKKNNAEFERIRKSE
ncbi:hypothetical protein KGF54_000716 [Candida jiufengensis]|uniref:uncharacterized protein n=1 Tax=Candida jiufengensis TaxID=497108 RepID=UPI002224B680|nr:uncharacterized protein KGF54_000716 [Candida jiufengensis]KAI5956241.1 hypothetical protein KGF54_000716 [Candida jiufengensis]